MQRTLNWLYKAINDCFIQTYKTVAYKEHSSLYFK